MGAREQGPNRGSGACAMNEDLDELIREAFGLPKEVEEFDPIEE